MTSQDAHWQSICGIQNFLWHISAEVASDFALVFLLPRFRIFMPVIDPISKLLEDVFNQDEIFLSLAL